MDDFNDDYWIVSGFIYLCGVDVYDVWLNKVVIFY